MSGESPSHEEASEVSEGPRLWNPDVAGMWSLLLTPVFGSVILMFNCRAMEDEEGYTVAQRWLAVSAVVLLAASAIPYSVALSLVYIVVWYFGLQRQQTRQVTRRWGPSYPKKAWFKPVAIGAATAIAYWLLWNSASWALRRLLPIAS